MNNEVSATRINSFLHAPMKTIPLGIEKSNSEALHWSPQKSRNMLIAGEPGVGKTELLKKIALHCIANASDWNTFYISLSGNNEAKEISENISLSFANDLDSAVKVLYRVQKEMLHRYSLMEKSSIDNYMKLDLDLPEIVLIVDDFDMLFSGEISLNSSIYKTLKKSQVEALRLLNSITMLGRPAGVQTVVAAQRAYSIPVELRFNFSTRVALGSYNNHDSEILLGNGKAAGKHRKTGHGYFQTFEYSTEFQTYISSSLELV